MPNGSAPTPASPADKSDQEKFKNRKEKFKKDRRDGKDTDGERPDTPADSEKAATAPGVAATIDSAEGGSTPLSPVTGEGGSRAQTPTSKKPFRSPWTLHFKAPAEVKEQQVREFFGDAKDGVSPALRRL